MPVVYWLVISEIGLRLATDTGSS